MCVNPIYAFRDYSAHMKHLITIGKRKSDIVMIRKESVPFGLSAREYRDQLVRLNPRIYEALDLSCGQCVQCRLQKASEWQTRMCLEYLTSDNALFLTFTYDDDHLPHSELGFPTLCPEDLRKFNKLLTQKLDRSFSLPSPKHFECGEYGSCTHRPHYHSIHFNLPAEILDLKLAFVRNGIPYYNSAMLSDLWKRGFVVVSGFSPAAAGYVARYVTKKLTGELNRDRFDKFGLVQEFTRVSNRPGIGFDYFKMHESDLLEWYSVILPKSGRVPLPKYYQHLFDLEGVDYESKKLEKQQIRQNQLDALLEFTGQTPEQYFEAQRIQLKERLAGLPRHTI